MGISSKRLRSRGLAVLALVALLASLLPAVPAWAGNVVNLSITSDNYKAGATTDYTADFTATSGIQPGDEITMVFGTGYVVSQQATAKIVYDDETYPATTSVLGTIVKVFAPAELDVANGGAVTVAVYGVTNPTAAGNYTIALRTTADATAVSDSVEITAADPAKLAIDSSFDENTSKDGIQVTAGSSKTITIKLQDEYGNDDSEATADISVKLSDTSGQSVTATIYAGSPSTTVTWTAPANAGSYTLTAEDVTKDASKLMQAASVDVEVVAASATSADITGPGYLDVNQEGTYTITLKDENGNNAEASSQLSLNLTSSPTDSTIFTPNPVTINAGESSATFKFKSSKAGMYTITASDTGVSGSKNVAVGVTGSTASR